MLEADARARRLAGAVLPGPGALRSMRALNLSWQHLLAFLFAVGLLVTVHEFGHYWVARRLGFKVLRFSVGFGKALWRRVAGADKTEYVIAAIPLGGYVKLLDEREGPVDPAEVHRAFNRRPHWQRILVLLAGPAFNICFAILLLAGAVLDQWRDRMCVPWWARCSPDSPAARAGIRSGDEILASTARRCRGPVGRGARPARADDRRRPRRVHLAALGAAATRTVVLQVPMPPSVAA